MNCTPTRPNRTDTPGSSRSALSTPAPAGSSSASPTAKPPAPASGETSTAPASSAAANSASAAPGPSIPIITPASAGPTSTLTLSIHVLTAFAAVRSAGSETSEGSSADCAGRTSVTALAVTTAPTYTITDGAPASRAAAVALSVSACSA